MTDNKWSEEQPPEWTGAPIGSTPATPQWQPPTGAPMPPAAPKPAAPARAELGPILRSVWRFLRARLALYVGGTAALSLVGLAVAVGLAQALFPNGLSEQAIAVLKGEELALAVSDSMSQAELDALMGVLGEVGTVAVLTILPVLLIQFICGSLITRMALGQAAGQTLTISEALRSTPFLKIFTSGMALTIWLIALFVPLILAMGVGAALGTIGILVSLAALMAFVAVIIWFGLGVTFISATVTDQNVGFFESVRRTLALAKGQRLVIFAAALIVSVCASLPVNLAVSAINTLAEFSFGTYFAAAILPVVLAAPSTAVLSAVLYRALRPSQQ